VLERTLRPGEKILVEPGGLLYKDSTVQMQAAQMSLKTGMMRHGMAGLPLIMVEGRGPGPLALSDNHAGGNPTPKRGVGRVLRGGAVSVA